MEHYIAKLYEMKIPQAFINMIILHNWGELVQNSEWRNNFLEFNILTTVHV